MLHSLAQIFWELALLPYPTLKRPAVDGEITLEDTITRAAGARMNGETKYIGCCRGREANVLEAVSAAQPFTYTYALLFARPAVVAELKLPNTNGAVAASEVVQRFVLGSLRSAWGSRARRCGRYAFRWVGDGQRRWARSTVRSLSLLGRHGDRWTGDVWGRSRERRWWLGDRRDWGISEHWVSRPLMSRQSSWRLPRCRLFDWS